MKDSEKSLAKELGLMDVFAVAAGAMISSGLFVLPGLAFERIGPAMILAYALAGIMIIPTMLAQAELSTAMPKSAGSYFVVERSLGAFIGTIAGFLNWCAIGLKAAFALIGIGTLAVLLSPAQSPWLIKGVAIAAGLVFMILNLLSVKGTGRLQRWMVVGLLSILGLYVLFSIPRMESARFTPFLSGSFAEFLAVTGMVFISFGGLNKILDISGEVRDPGKNIPRGMFLSFILVNIMYVLVGFATVAVLDRDTLTGSLRPLAEGANAVMGTAGLVIMAGAAFLAYATTGNAGILSASRSPMAMSRDGLLPDVLSRTSKRFGTPHVSILVTGSVMIVLIAFLSIEDLAKTASTMLLLSLALINISVIIMRKSGIEGYRPTFRMPLVPYLPAATAILYLFIIAEMGLFPLLVTTGCIAAVCIWYIAYVQHKIDRMSAIVYLVKTILSRHIQRTGLEDELVQISLERDDIQADRFDKLVQKAPILDIRERLTARELFERIAEAMSPRMDMSAERICELLLERERESNTVIQPGLAIPHILIEGKESFDLALVRCREGAVFSELQEPVHTVFVLMGSPDERNFHLRALMAIAHVVQGPDFAKRWQGANNAEQLRDIVLLSARPR